MLAHLLSLSNFVGVPFGFFLGPVAAYFAQKESKFVRFHAIQSCLFQLSILGLFLLIYGLSIAIAVMFSVSERAMLMFFLATLASLILALLLYVTVMGMKAKNGECAQYPLAGAWAFRKVYSENWIPL
jgi:uncharacterized Tic20 family protein